MNHPKCILVLLLLILFPFWATAQVNPTYTTIPASYNINSGNPLYALDINYDNVDLNKQAFHLFLPDTTDNYPLVIYIHGGGFTGGSRDVVLGSEGRIADIKYFLERGVAFASIGYRLIETEGPDDEGVIKSLMDAKRALQFIRHHAEEFHIKPEQIALSGGSAGAGTGIWLGTRPDMADPDAADLVLRESTRVCAVHTSASQATYDLYKWETEVYQNYDGQGTTFTIDSIVNLLGFERASNFYGGLDSIDQILHDDALIQYRQDVDMLYHMSSDDPPLYIENRSGAILPSQDLFHHSLHGNLLLSEAERADISEVKAIVSTLGIDNTEGEAKNDFLLRHLNGCAETTSTNRIIRGGRVNVYPNPASEQVTVSLDDHTSISSVALFAISGRLIIEQHSAFAETVTLPVSSLRPGMYILQVENGEGARSVQKVVVE